MKTFRAFVCVEISEAARDRLGALQGRLKRDGARVTWVAPANMHLTLAFLGDTSVESVGPIGDALDGVASGHRPIGVALAGAGGFPTLERARVFWVGLSGDVEALAQMQRDVASALRRIGVAWDEKPFSPHITLGRVKDPRDPAVARVGRQLGSSRFDPVELTFDRVVLMRSDLGPAGPRYTPLHVSTFSRA